MDFGTAWFLLLALGTSVSSRIVKQWPVIPDEKLDSNYFYDFERNDRDWNGYYAFDHDVKPVKEVQTIIVTKNVPVPYPPEEYLSIPSHKNFRFPVPVEKEDPFHIKKIIPIPVGARPPFSLPGSQPNNSPFSYSFKYVKVPVPHSLSHAIRTIEQKIPVSYPREASISHREVPYPFPLHFNLPVDKPEPETNEKVPETIIVEKETPHFSIYLVPFPVEKSALHGAQPDLAGGNEKPEVKPGYFTNLKPQDARSQLYSVTHKLYNSLKNDKRPPQVVDYNHPIDHDEE